MSVIPCTNDPPRCLAEPNPLTPYSSEYTDSETFIGTAWSSLQPILDQYFEYYPFFAVAESSLSQDDADFAAQRAADEGTLPCMVFYRNAAQGATAICPDGLEFTYTVPAGVFTALSQLAADRMAYTYALRKVWDEKVCLSSLQINQAQLVETCLGTAFSASVNAVGNYGPFVFSLYTGALPPGVTMNQTGVATVTVSGTPTTSGIYQFGIQAIDGNGNFMRKLYVLYVPWISTGATLPSCTEGTPYSAQLATANFSAPITSWTLVGALPPGLTLSASSGLISGIPTIPGTYSFIVAVTDGLITCAKSFSITENYAPVQWILIPQTANPSIPTQVAATLAAEPGTFTLIYTTSSTGKILDSPDGVIYSTVVASIPGATGIRVLLFGQNGGLYTWMAGDQNGKVWNSQDGISYTSKTVDSGKNIQYGAYYNGVFAVSTSGGNVFVSHDSGNSWVNGYSHPSAPYGLAAAGDLWTWGQYGLYWGGTPDNFTAIAGSSIYGQGMAYGNGFWIFLVKETIANSGENNNIYRSSNEISFSKKHVYLASDVQDITFGSSKFAVVSASGFAWSSPDGVTWTSHGKITSAGYGCSRVSQFKLNTFMVLEA